MVVDNACVKIDTIDTMDTIYNTKCSYTIQNSSQCLSISTLISPGTEDPDGVFLSSAVVHLFVCLL